MSESRPRRTASLLIPPPFTDDDEEEEEKEWGNEQINASQKPDRKDRSTVPCHPVYPQRWWVLVVFSFASFLLALIWNTWGPLAVSAKAVFGWSDSTIGMFAAYGNIAFIIAALPASWLIDVKGIGFAMKLCTGTVLLAAGLRCITVDPTVTKWLSVSCALLNGLGLPVTFGGPALISSTWFPVSQSATVTAVSSFFNYIGVAMAFVIGPQIVSPPIHRRTGNDSHHNDSFEVHEAFGNTSSSNATDCGLAAVLFIATMVYFPAKPPRPPRDIVNVEETSYRHDLLSLIKKVPVFLIVFAYALPTGTLSGWSSVLDVNLSSRGISQMTAGWLGFYQTLAGGLGSLIIARFSDKFMGKIKLMLIVCMIGAVASSACFTVVCDNLVPFNIVVVYVSSILIGIFVNGPIPLFYEIACEASYPVNEGVTGVYLTLMNSLLSMSFLLILKIPDIGKAWMNWCLLAMTVLALPLLILFPERYNRTNLSVKDDAKPGGSSRADEKTPLLTSL